MNLKRSYFTKKILGKEYIIKFLSTKFDLYKDYSEKEVNQV